MAGKKNKKHYKVTKRTIVFNVMMWLCVLISVTMLCYPFFERTLARIGQVDTINSYIGEIQSLNADEIDRLREEAVLYNQKIYENQKNQPFQYSEEGETDEEYQNILTNQMAVVDVPDQDIYLPIVHGTDYASLKNNAGHMYGTSVPVGGENTLSVVAAHDGLVSAKLFTNVPKMEVGDVFYIHVLGEVREYKVMEESDIITCTPEEEYKYLQIKEGKDQVALYTCYPYGINTHRRIVVGTFTRMIEEGDDVAGTVLKGKVNTIYYIEAGILVLIPLGVLTAGIMSTVKNVQDYRKSKKKKKTDFEITF